MAMELSNSAQWMVKGEWVSLFHVSPENRWVVHRSWQWEACQPERAIPSATKRCLYQVSHVETGYTCSLLRLIDLGKARRVANTLCSIFADDFPSPSFLPPSEVEFFFKTLRGVVAGQIIADPIPPVQPRGITRESIRRLRGIR